MMTAKEVAEYLKLHEITLCKYAAAGKIPAIRIGRVWRFDKEAVDAWTCVGVQTIQWGVLVARAAACVPPFHLLKCKGKGARLKILICCIAKFSVFLIPLDFAIMSRQRRISMKDDQLLGRIVLDPKIMVGKPVIRGTRLTVDFILNLLAHGATEKEILEEYRGLTGEDIRACFLFATKALKETEFMPLEAESA